MRQRLGEGLLAKLPAVWWVFYLRSVFWSTGCLMSLAEDARKQTPVALPAGERHGEVG
jgi:hypothetical protein